MFPRLKIARGCKPRASGDDPDSGHVWDVHEV